MHSNIDAAAIVAFHDRQLRNPDWPVFDDAQSSIWAAIAANHRFNGLRWREDERARRLDVPSSEIAAGKRLVDRYDRKRTDALEAIDERLLGELGRVSRQPEARLSSESAGAMIDRLAVLALQIHHMRAQARRHQAGAAHLHACACQLERLDAQRQDLMGCLDSLLLDARAGRAFFKLYRLDPALHRQGEAGP